MRPLGFIALTVAAIISSPLAAQQPKTVGFLTSGSMAAMNEQWVAAVLRGLRESGFVDGQNVSIEYRAANNDYDKLPGLVRELVQRPVGVIIAAGGPISAVAAKNATKDVPVVFTTIADPVKSGLVASLNRPGGNLTGTAGLTTELDAKRLELLHMAKPSKGKIGVLANLKRPDVDAQSKALEAAARAIGRDTIVRKVSSEQDFGPAFEELAQQHIDALVVTADPLFNFHRKQVVGLAARHAIPAIYQWREFVADGGLMSYGPSIEDAYHQAGVYAGRILNGASPAELPVVQPTRFYLIINAKTAKTLGLNLPPNLLAIANETLD